MVYRTNLALLVPWLHSCQEFLINCTILVWMTIQSYELRSYSRLVLSLHSTTRANVVLHDSCKGCMARLAWHDSCRGCMARLVLTLSCTTRATQTWHESCYTNKARVVSYNLNTSRYITRLVSSLYGTAPTKYFIARPIVCHRSYAMVVLHD